MQTKDLVYVYKKVSSAHCHTFQAYVGFLAPINPVCHLLLKRGVRLWDGTEKWELELWVLSWSLVHA